MTRLTTEFGGALLAVLMLSPTTEAVAQSVEDAFRQTLREAAKASKLGNSFQSLSIFGATPGVSTAVFDVDQKEPNTDFALRTAKLPISHDFAPVIAGIRPYGELTLGYVHADEKEAFDLVPGEETKINADFDTYSALAGIGATIPIVPHLSLRPIFLAGYSRITGDARFKGPFAEDLKAASSGLITDLTINTLLLGGALQARSAWRLGESIELVADARYNHFYARNFDASDSVLETADDFGVYNTRAEVDGPTPLTIFGRATRWIGFAGYTYLPGDQKDALGFDSFCELGGGFAVIYPEFVEGISGLSARASLIVGKRRWLVGRFVPRVLRTGNPNRLPPDIHVYTSSKPPRIVLPPGIPAVQEHYDRNLYRPADSLARRRAVLG